MPSVNADIALELQSLDRQLRTMNQKFDRAFDKTELQAKKSGSAIGRGLKAGLGFVGITSAVGVAQSAIRGFFDVVKDGLQGYDVQQKAETKLLTALKGRMDVQNDLIKQAQELQKVSLFGDEVTIEAQAMLAAMGLTGDAVKRLTPLVQDLATKANMSLVGAADLVAKSVGSSTNALSRYGIQIEGAVGSSERLDSAIEALNKQVGGQAAAAAATGLGAWQQAMNVWDDAKELIGAELAPVLIDLGNVIKNINFEQVISDIKAFVRGIGLAADATIAWNKILIGRFKAGGTEMLEVIRKVNEDGWFNFIDVTKQATEATQKAVDQIGDGAIELEAVTIGWTGAIAGAKLEIEELNKRINNAAASELPALGDALERANIELERLQGLTAGTLPTGMNTDIDQITGAGASSVGAGVSLESPLQGMIEQVQSDKEFITSEVQQFVGSANQLVQSAAADMFSGIGQGIADAVSGIATGLSGILGIFGDFIKQFGELLIAYGTANAAFKNAFSNPFAAIAAGVALVALGGIIKNLISKGPDVPALAIGTNMVHSDGIAQLHRGEAIVPANVASGGFTGGTQRIEIIGKTDGRDIYWTNKRASEEIERIS